MTATVTGVLAMLGLTLGFPGNLNVDRLKMSPVPASSIEETLQESHAEFESLHQSA